MKQQEDRIFKMFCEPERWQYAISRGVDKDMPHHLMRFLTSPEGRIALLDKIRKGEYKISPPHTALIPKDTPGEFREVVVNEPFDRVILSIVNDMLFELMPEMVHPRCTSYQKGIGCGKVVQDVSKRVISTDGNVIGWKADLSKYFDSVPIRFIDEAFDRVEAKYGHSCVIDLVRAYYHWDIFINEDGVLCNEYKSLKQGCAVAAWLADVVLYHIDETISQMDVYYVRYSDDILCVGNDYAKAMDYLGSALSQMELVLNPKKVEYLSKDKWFKFLGFSIKGSAISLSPGRIKSFQKEIEKRTIKSRDSYTKCLNSVNRYLYKGDGEHSWATQVLPIVNVRKDIDTLNMFVMDCLRAVQTNKRKMGGLGYVKDSPIGCIARGTGRNVKANRFKTSPVIDGYYTIGCMQNALRTRRAVYETLVASL